MFAKDRDLLVLEPGLFGEVNWVGQRLVAGTGTVSGTTLTLTQADAGLDDAGVGAGHVVLIGGTGYEVLARLSATEMTVSRLRADEGDAPIAPAPVTGATVSVFTFAPQIGEVHRRTLRMLGVESAAEIVNGAALSMLEALGALHLVYAGASAHAGPSSPAGQRADWYRQRYEAERRRVVAEVDVNGDGAAEVARRPGVGRWVRV